MAAALFTALAGAAPVGAETFYRYETESGSIAFTDERERVPKLYRDEAEAVPAGSLLDYERTSIAGPMAGRATAVTSLPAVEEPVSAAQPPSSAISLQLAPGVSVEMPDSSAKPIRVDHDVLRWEDGRLRRFTVIRRGSEVLAEIREDCC